MADPFAGRRYEDRTGKGMYEDANSGLLKGVRDYLARRNQEAAEARGRVVDAYESGGLGRALGRTAREVYDDAVGKVGAVRDAVLGLRRMQAEAGNQVIAGFTGEEVRPQAAPTPTPEGAQERTFGAAGSREGDLGKGLPPGYKVSNTGVDGVYRVDGGSSPLFTNLNPAEAVKGLRGGTVNTINMRAGNEALARANAIRQEYLDSQAGSDGGPRVGLIGGGGYGLRFNRRSEERAADRAHRQALLQLAREKFEFDKSPKPLSELEQLQLEAARRRFGREAASHTRELIGDMGYDTETQRRILQNRPDLVEADPAQQLPLIADQARNIKLSDAANQYSIGGLRSDAYFTPVKEDTYDWAETRFWDDDPNTPNVWEMITSDKGDVVVGKDGRRVNAKRLKADTKDLDLLTGLRRGLRQQP